jgi:hypothetical protein
LRLKGLLLFAPSFLLPHSLAFHVVVVVVVVVVVAVVVVEMATGQEKIKKNI